jgi:hypothetical protein
VLYQYHASSSVAIANSCITLLFLFSLASVDCCNIAAAILAQQLRNNNNCNMATRLGDVFDAPNFGNDGASASSPLCGARTPINSELGVHESPLRDFQAQSSHGEALGGGNLNPLHASWPARVEEDCQMLHLDKHLDRIASLQHKMQQANHQCLRGSGLPLAWELLLYVQLWR